MNNDRMSCGEACEKLPLFVGGDLDPDVLESVRRHLEFCSACAARAAEALRARRELVAAFRSREADFVRPELWSGIRSKLRTEGLVREAGKPTVLDSVPGASRRTRGTRWSLALAPLVAAAVVLFVLELSGAFRAGEGSQVLPSPEGPRSSGPELVGNPATLPVGGLQPIPADEASELVPFRERGGGVGRFPMANDVSAAAFSGAK